MNIVDPILLVLLSLFALRGYFKGLFREAFSLLGLFAGLMIAVRYEQPVAALWAESWKSSFIFLRALTFVALFFLTYFSLNLIGWLLHRSASLLFLQGINRIGGVVLGAGKGAAIMALAIFFLTSTPLISGKAKEKIGHSYLVPAFNQLAAELVELSKTKLLGPKESRASVSALE
ncbi:MAG TPA: CvpA family protein [Candidatus Binatia bacterium]